MAKIRHIAYRAANVDAMAKFFVDAMGMKMIQKRKNNAIDLSDGSVNITVLPLRAGTPDGSPRNNPASIISASRRRTIRRLSACWRPPARRKLAR
jgi:catechol 2,3-dioxygenase-like lactoylglutathione lyase family enzyme